MAVDNVIERIVTHYPPNIRPSMVRLGHPARISQSIHPYCLEGLISSADGTDIVKDVRKELDTLRKTMSKERDKSQRRLQRTEIKTLQKEIRSREEKVLKNILNTRDVIFCTLVGAASKLLRDIEFDIVVIDEAAQALEVACWIPMLKSNKCVLAGDHCQLPPTVKSEEAERGGLGVTLFQRIMSNPKMIGVPRLLNTQYRMNRVICDWASAAMYHNKLLSDESVANRTLSDIVPKTCNDPDQDAIVSVDSVMMLIDTAGCFMHEQLSESKSSHRNLQEVDLVCKHIDLLVNTLGVKSSEIGIVTPYNGQLESLREKIGAVYSDIDMKTVDGFQGGEKEVIILSLVRSNDSRTVGFLADKRRINVAVTRAKRHVAVICDTDTCSTDPFLKQLFDYISECGDHRSAMEYAAESQTATQTTSSSSHVLLPPSVPLEHTVDISSSSSSDSSAFPGVETPKPQADTQNTVSNSMMGVSKRSGTIPTITL